MPKSNLAPSQNWDINSHISQSKDIAKQQEKELNNYKEKTDAINRINSKLDDYESFGLDVSQYRKRLDTKTKDLELGFGEKLGVVGRNIGNDYSRAIPGIGRFLDKHIMNKEVKPIPKSYSQQMDAAKQDREETINPISTMALEVGMDPLTYTPLRFASKGTRLARAAKDFGKGSALSTGTYTMKEIGNDNFKAKDALLAGAFGGVLNSGIGAFANRKIKGNLLNGDVTSHENIMHKGLQEGKEITVPRGEKIKHKTVETAGPYADETMQNEFIDDDEIARRMLNQNEEAKINQKLPNELPLHDEQAIKDLMKYSAKNNAIDEFISKLPDTANKEETFKILKKLELQEANNTAIKKPNLEANNTAIKKPNLEANNTVIKKPNLKEQNNINLPPIKKSTDDILFQPKPKNSVLPKSLPLNNRQEMEEIIKYAIKNNAEDEFISKLPQNADKEKAFDFLTSIKEKNSANTKNTQKLNVPTEKELIQKEGVDRRLSYAKNAMLSNGSQNLGGATVGGLEAEATNKDYNNDGVHDYKDNVIGALIGVLGINGAKKIFPKAFKDKNINKNTAGMFVGAKPNDKGAFSDIATKKTMKEIDDSKAIVKPFVDGKISHRLNEVLEHPELFEKYPELKDIQVSKGNGNFYDGNNHIKTKDTEGIKSDLRKQYDEFESNIYKEAEELDSKGLLTPEKEKEFEKLLNDFSNKIKKDEETLSFGPKKSTLLHELQHVVQNKEKWAKGGSPDEFADTFKSYQRLHGEQQARATEQRMNYAPEQRASEDWTKTLERTEGKYDEPIIKYDGDVAMSAEKENSFLERFKKRTQAKIDNGEIPERGRTVVSPYEKGREYYLGESGKVYFKRANGKWIETPNESTIKDVKYVSKNGLNAFKKMRGEEDLRFEKAMQESIKREEEKAKSYKMDHKAPTKEDGVSADDITEMFSKDIYTKDAERLFGHGASKMDKESISLINKVRNKPHAEVTIYRAVPKELNVNINPDDWITTSKEYAKVHGESALKGNYKILEMKVKAKDLYTDGNSIHEWGWSPAETPSGMIAMSSPTLSGGMVGGVVGATNDLDGDGQITYKDIALGALGGAGSTKGIILAKNTNAVSKATKKLKEIADTDFVDAFTGHKIYEKKSYMKTREAMISAKNKKMEDFAELHEQLNLLSDDVKKNLHRYMTGEKVKLSDSIKKLADNYINQIEKQGKELVDLGILEKAQYEKFKGRYLHRVYEKDLLKDFSQAFKKGKTLAGVHTRGREWTGTKAEYEKYLSDNKIGSFFDGKIEAYKLNNGHYKFSQDWTPEQRKKWGEVEDIAYTLPETLMRMSEMAEHGKFLQKVSKDMNVISDEALDGYTQLKGKRFGALRDKYVPKDVADDITEFNRVMFGEEDGAIFSKEVKEAYRALSTFWKKSHTVYNPVAHVNNLMSNVTMQFMEGINPTKALKHAKDGALAHMKLGEFRKLTAKKLIGLTKEETKKLNLLANDSDLQLYIKANNSGLFGRSRLNDILSQYVGPTQKSKVPGTLRKLDEVSSNYYQGEDNIMRFSMLKSLVDSGKSFDEAIKQTNNTIPDYTKPMSRMAKFGRKSMLTPFISWTYYSTPIILRQFKEHPGRAAVILGALYGINKAVGIDPYNKKDIPQQNFSMKRIPIYRNGNEITTIKVDRWMPHNEILSPHDFVKNLYNGGAWKGGYEVLNNKNLYYGGKITHNEGMRKAYDISKYAVQQITPDIIDKAWNFTESAIIDKKTRSKNPVIQPRSTVQELLNAVGLNTLTYNKANQNRKVKNEELRK